MAEQDSSVSYQFTKLGNDLSVKALAGTVKLDFTKAELSTDNHFNDTEADVAIMTGMGNVAQTVELKEVDAVEDDQSYVKVPVLINEAEITEDYALMTIGLYCKPDDGDEVLYSICSLKDPIYMHKSSNNSTFALNLNTLVGSAANVVIKVDPAGMVTNATFDAFKVTMGQQYALKSDLDTYLKELPANVALTDKANTFTEQQTLAGGAVNGAGKKALFDGDVDVPSDVVRADMLKPNLIDVATDDALVADGKTIYTVDVVKGQKYFIGITQVGSSNTTSVMALYYGYVSDGTFPTAAFGNVANKATDQVNAGSIVATSDGTIQMKIVSSNSDIYYKHLVVTHSNNAITYAQAQANRHGWNGIDENSGYGAENLILNSGNVNAWEHWKIAGPHADVGYGVATNSTYHNGADKVFYMNTTYKDKVYCVSDKFQVQPNTKYAYSVLMTQNANVQSVDVYYLSVHPTLLQPTITVSTTGFSLIKGTFVTSGDDTVGQFRIDNNGSTDGKTATLQFIEVKVAREDMPSSYSPAPQDYQPALTLPDGETKYIWKGTTTDLTQSLLALPVGVTTFYADGFVTNNPTKNSLRGYAHITTVDGTGSLGVGWLISNNGDMWEFFISGKSVKYTQLASKDYVDQKMQTAVDQIQPLIDADDKKHNLPSYFWSGTADEYAAVTPKVADADYSVYE